jgi:hypothetical protein
LYGRLGFNYVQATFFVLAQAQQLALMQTKGTPEVHRKMANKHARGKSKRSPENRRKTAAANLAHGVAHRFKPGQSGNPGGRPRTAKLSEACRAKLASPIPGDPESRSYAEAIADKLAQLALKGDIRAAQELADRAEGRPSHMAPPAEQNGVKVIILDVPRPPRPVAAAASPQLPLPETRSDVTKVNEYVNQKAQLGFKPSSSRFELFK